MKTINLISNYKAAEPLELTELMLVNSLQEIARLDDQVDDLQDELFYYKKVLDALKADAEFYKSSYKDYISLGYIHRDEWVFQELMDLFDLHEPEEDEEPEEAAEEKEKEEE